jgi:two-component system NtrC family sensor kinase
MTSANTTETLGTSDAASTPGTSTPPATFTTSGHRFVLSIRTKGMFVFTALIAYSVVVAFFAFHQKNLLLRDFEEIQGTLETEAMLRQADVSTFHAVMAIFANIDKPDHAAGMRNLRMHHQALLHRHAELTARLPNASMDVADLNTAWEEANKDSSRTNLNRLIVELIKAKNNLALLTEQVQESRKFLSERYRMQSDSVAMTTFLLGMLGLGLLGAIIGLFFRRLTDDIRILQSRALEIVKGFRGEPLTITRHDEVGQLMIAVNNMADTLDRREKELMLERQKYFHQEKMAAIGALAAGVTHEIGNPIAAIAGIAQEMVERRATSGIACTAEDCHDCRPELIYAQTQRLAAITREISEFASPRAAEPQLLDLNAQLRSTSSLIRYDKRLQRVTLRLDLDSQLPAIYGVADQLTQLIMNLLINAMDALEGVQGRTPTIVITTRADTERVCVAIEDNGHGIDSETLSRVFEAFFTTKPAGKGTGLGLSLCYSITKKHGGTIEIDSTPDMGTRVQVFFPLNDTAYNEANSI